MFIQDGKHIVQGYVHPRAPNELLGKPLPGLDGVGEEGMVLITCLMVYSQIPSPTLVGDGIFHVLIFKDGQINLHVASGFSMMSAMMGTLEAL